MVAGHLQEKKGYFYIVLSYKDAGSKRKTKWMQTGLPVKGNKRKAEAMLAEARNNFEEPVAVTQDGILFSDFMLSWLEMWKSQVELTTFASYSQYVKKRIAPYFKKKGILLTDLQPMDIQEFYRFQMEERGVSANTAIHYHANIRKALQYAVKVGLIPNNPADRVDRPRKEKFVGGFYDNKEINALLDACAGQKIELAVILGSYYGLRRSEIVGLKWDAIDFDNNSITIRHTVIETTLDGKVVMVEKDRTKNKSSYRSLPLVPEIKSLLQRLQAEQEENRKVCANAYNTEYLGYLYVDELGNRIKPNYITQNFARLLRNKGLRKIRFHDLRHSCASLMLANGVPMKQIQEWLGHSDFGTTANTYTHLDFNSKLSSAQAMSDTLSGSNLFKKERERLKIGRELAQNRREQPGEEQKTDEEVADG